MNRQPRGATLRWPVAALIAALIATVTALGAPDPAAAAQTLEDGQWWHTQWEMDRVWQISDGSGVSVAVIDSGIDPSVPELAGALLPGADVIGADGRVGDHGTSMASLIAGRGGNRGYHGVAPGASVLPIITAVDEQPTEGPDNLALGIRYAVDNDAQVVNISRAGDPGPEQICPASIADAVRYAADNDVVVVAGSGNDAGGPTPYPGNCPGVLTVGATDWQLNPWSDSHRSEHVDVAAPGVDISAIGRGGQELMGSGTSGSTALVSGTIALIRAEYPDASADEVLRRIIHTAGDIHTPGRDDATGHGIVQPIYALTEPLPPDAPNPIYEQLYADDEQPGASLPPLSTGGPGMQAGQDSQNNRVSGISAMLIPVVVLGSLTAIVLAVIVIAVVAANRRRPAHSNPTQPPYPQAPPHYPPQPPHPGP